MVFFVFIQILIENSVHKTVQTLIRCRILQNAASDLGIHCLPMSHKKGARRIWVKMLHLGCIGMDPVISKSCYKGIIRK